jgi:hypothetical protein
MVTKKRKMNRLTVLGIFLAGFFSLHAQHAKYIQFREEIYDFGTVREEGGPVEHEFLFTNTTNRPVRILGVQASCGCTTPGWTTEPVPSGKTGFVKASYNPKGRPGFFNKTLTVTTDFDATPVVLQIKGTVNKDGDSDIQFVVANGNWKFKSGSLNMGKVHLNQEPTVRDFPFINAGTKPVTVSEIIAPGYIHAEVLPKTVGPKEKAHLKLVYNGEKKNQYGFQTDNIEIHTDDTSAPVKSFTVYATLEDHFGELKPEDMAKAPRLQLPAGSMEFGRVGKSGSMTRELTITNSGRSELIIKAAQPNCTCVTAEVSRRAIKPGESTTVKITFDASERKGTQNKAITFYSNDPRNPVQRFTFTAYVED